MPNRTAALLLAAPLLLACRESSTAPIGDDVPVTVLVPPCATPAPLNGKPNSPDISHLVAYKPGVDPGSETVRLAQVHGFTATHVFRVGAGGFSSALTPRQVAAIRCEASVQLIEYNLRMTIAGGS